MIVIQSSDSFDELYLLDPQTEKLTKFLKSENPELASLRTRGLCRELNGSMLCLYRQEGNLLLRVEDRTFPFDEAAVSWNKDRHGKRTLRLYRGDELVYQAKYRIDNIDELCLDMVPFVEEDAVDFGRFLYEVFVDTDRRSRIWS